MINGVYQRCYTNAEKEFSTGWQSVAVSDDIPYEISDFCEKLQARNSHNINTIAFECGFEKAEDMNLLEIDCYDGFLCMTRTQYGLYSRGRSNLFAHTYILPLNDDTIKNPNSFLTIANTNFAACEEDALSEKTSFDRLGEYDVTNIISKYGIEKENLITYIGSIMARFMVKDYELKPIFIQYDGSDEQLRDLLFLMYKLVPPFIRKQISIASFESPNKLDKSFIFSTKASQKSTYVDLFSGRSSFFDGKVVRSVKKYGYSLYAVRNYSTEDIEVFYEELSTIAVKLIGYETNSKQVLGVAYRILKEKPLEDCDAYEVEDRFFEILDIDSDTEYYRDYLAKAFSVALKNNIKLSDNDIAYLRTIVNLQEETAFESTYKDYEITSMERMTIDEATKYFCSLDDNTKEFLSNDLVTKLSENKGRQILENYYKNYKLKVNTWESKADVVEEIIRKKALFSEDFTTYLKSMLDESFFSSIRNADLSIYRRYKSIMREFYGDEVASEKIYDAQCEYWGSLRFSDIKFDAVEFYNEMSENCPFAICQMFLKYISLPKYYAEDLISYLRYTYSFFNLIEVFKTRYSAYKDEAVSTLIQYLTKVEPSQSDRISGITKIASVDSVMSEAMELIEQLIKSFISLDSYDRLIYLYRQSIDIIKREGNKSSTGFVNMSLKMTADSLISDLNDYVIFELHQIDNEKTFVPLDFWLFIADSMSLQNNDNPFKILADQKPCLLNVSPEAVVESSVCIKNPAYIELANAYIKSNGSLASQVKKWLK